MPKSSQIRNILMPGGSAVRLLSRSSNRYRFVLSGLASTTNILYLGMDSTVSATSGYPLALQGSPIDWALDTHGDIVQQEIWGFCSGNFCLGVLEVMADCPCEVAAENRARSGVTYNGKG